MRMGLLVVSILVFGGCGGSGGDDVGASFDAPAVAPIVRDATPAALRPTASATLLAGDMSTPGAALTAMFKDLFQKISGGQAEGLINAAIEDLDSRVAGEEMASVGSPCLSAQVAAHHVDATSVAAAFDMTLGVQCQDKDMAGTGGGIVFGQDADDYSLWLSFANDAESSKFGYFANVTAASTADRSVDVLWLDDSPQIGGRVEAYRVRAQPSTGSFEVIFAGTDASGYAIGCGFQVISDGVHIWATGNHVLGGTCTGATQFALCFDALNMDGLPDDTVCDSLKTGFSWPPYTGDDLMGAGPAFDAVLPVATADGETTPVFP